MGNREGKSRRHQFHSYFDVHTATKFFLVGTFNNYSSENNQLETYDDLDKIFYKKGVRIKSISFIYADGRIIGYYTEYSDIYDNRFLLSRIGKNYGGKSKLRNSKNTLVLSQREHIVNLEITFNYEYITSVLLETNRSRSLFIGEVSPYTTITRVSSSQGELNVIFGFESGFSPYGIKELFVFRGVVIHKKKSSNIISIEKYDRFIKKTVETSTEKEAPLLERAKLLQKSESETQSTKQSPANSERENKDDEFFTQEFYNRRDEEGEEKDVNLDSPLKSSARSRKGTILQQFLSNEPESSLSKQKYQRKRTISRSSVVPMTIMGSKMRGTKLSKLPNHIQFDTVSPATKLLEKRRKMYEVHEAFEAQKEEYKKYKAPEIEKPVNDAKTKLVSCRQEEIFKRHEEAIRERDLLIQEDLIKFCKFLQENEGKKIRAEKRLDGEKAALKKKKTEISDLEEACKKLQNHQIILENKLKALKPYEDYLDTVKQASQDQYQEIKEIKKRHDTLHKSQLQLNKGFNEISKKFDELKYEAVQYEKEKNNEIMQLNNEIKELTKRLDEKMIESRTLQLNVDETTQNTSSQNLNLGKILLAIDNLYKMCSTFKSQNYTRILHEAEETNLEKNDIGKDKKEKGKNSNENKGDSAKPSDPQDDMTYYRTNVEKSISQLKAVGLYMSDFKKLIEACRKELMGVKDSRSKHTMNSI